MNHRCECLSVIRKGEPCNCVCKKHPSQYVVEWFTVNPPKPAGCVKCIKSAGGFPSGHEISEEETAVKP